MAFGFSAVIPLQKDDSDGFYALTKTIAQNTKQNIRNLFLTNPGERVMIPDFGVGLTRHLFEPHSFELQDQITENIEDQIDKFMPFVEINKIHFDTHGDTLGDATIKEKGNILAIKVFYSIPSKRISDIITVSKI